MADLGGMDDTSLSSASLRFLLLGDVGVGKSAFVDSFISTLTNVQTTVAINESIHLSPAGPGTEPISLPSVRANTGAVFTRNKNGSAFEEDPLGLLPPRINVPARELTFVDLPGYSSTLNPSTVLSLTDEYLNHHLHKVTSIFAPTIASSQLAWFLISGSRAHTLPTCAFYFVLYELKPIDILYMKMVHERVNLIPVLTKADSVSEKELWVLKRRMLRQLKMNGIQIHTFGKDFETIERMAEDHQWGAPPFVVSSRRNREGQLLRSELKQCVDLCLYGQVRHLQETAAQKVIQWKAAFGPAANPGQSNVEKIWTEKNHTPNINPNPSSPVNTAQVNNSQTGKTLNGHTLSMRTSSRLPGGNAGNGSPVQYSAPPSQQAFTQPATYLPPPSSTSNFTPPPSSLTNPANFGLPETVAYAPPPSFNKPSSVSTVYSTPGAAASGMISPPPSSGTTNSYSASTTYSPPPRTTSTTTASQARMTMIHNTTGMTIDSSTRPNEIMDDNMMNTVHTPTGHGQDRKSDGQGSFMESYTVPPGSTDGTPLPTPLETPVLSPDGTERSEFKVEIPNSGSSYQPLASETVTDLSSTLGYGTQLQQQPPFLIPGGFQTPGTTFLIPPSDLYQAVLSNDYGEPMMDIWQAAELGDVATVQLHLNNGVSPDQRNATRSTLLHRTAWLGVRPFAIMNLLISYGANVNLTNENGNTVLQNVLMKHDDPALIKLLLDNGAEAMIPNKEGMNPLEVAALFNKLESARYLLENDLSSSEPQSIANAMQRARSPDKKVMKALLKSWQGKEGEKKRAELMDRLRSGAGAGAGNSGSGHGLGTNGEQANSSSSGNGGSGGRLMSDAASVRSFETTKGEGKSSKWLKLKF